MRTRLIKNIFMLRKLTTRNKKYIKNDLRLKGKSLSETYEIEIWYDPDAKALYRWLWKGDDVYFSAVPAPLN